MKIVTQWDFVWYLSFQSKTDYNVLATSLRTIDARDDVLVTLLQGAFVRQWFIRNKVTYEIESNKIHLANGRWFCA